jgi:hypothetical protein
MLFHTSAELAVLGAKIQQLFARLSQYLCESHRAGCLKATSISMMNVTNHRLNPCLKNTFFGILINREKKSSTETFLLGIILGEMT